MSGKGDTPRPLSVSTDTFAERWKQTFGARRELTRLLRAASPSEIVDEIVAHALARCPTCKGEGRDPDHFKNACPECGGDGKRKEAA